MTALATMAMTNQDLQNDIGHQKLQAEKSEGSKIKRKHTAIMIR